jgi:dihydropteroate synthase
MGILNVTPDSFSDGGRFLDPAAAVAHAERMVAEDADIIDVGAESTRPYGDAVPVALEEEMARLAPVLPAVIALGRPVSIDTLKAKVADWALARGAAIVNDVWGLQRDPDMARVVAAHGVPVVIMHNRETADPAIDIMADIAAFFARSLAIAEAAGIARERIVLDPGIGFGKTVEQNLALINHLSRFDRFNLPLMIGTSRKTFIGKILNKEPHERLMGTAASVVAAIFHGAHIVRVHDVREMIEVVKLADAIYNTPERPEKE